MFGLFRKRKQDDADGDPLSKKERAIIEVCSGVLTIQSELIGRKHGKYNDSFSIRYVWGYADAVLQNNSISLETKGLIMLSLVFMRIFGKNEGQNMLGRAVRLHQSNDKVM